MAFRAAADGSGVVRRKGLDGAHPGGTRNDVHDGPPSPATLMADPLSAEVWRRPTQLAPGPVSAKGDSTVIRLALVTGLLCIGFACPGAEPDARLQTYLEVLKQQGKEPIPFVVGKLDTFDLLIFDDALHTAVEPFEFYQQLVKDAAFQRRAPAIFLEVIPSNKQRHLDDYLAAPSDDPRLLYPAFQDDANGLGFPYKTYFDFLQTVRTVNQSLPKDARPKVFGVGSPTWWAEIQTPRDLEQFRKSLASYDHHMYTSIRDELDQFQSNKKGIVLTNTRHAYKGIKRKDGQLFWNAATLFEQRHPGKAYSIRLHNVTLSVLRAKEPPAGSPRTAEGRERMEYKFVRMARGLWDDAFHANGDRPVAVPLVGSVFGREPYVGNHQLDALPDQKMQDAYDAVIFLAPIEKLRQTAFIDFIYTPTFQRELKRRYRILYTDAQLADLYRKNQAEDLDGLVSKTLSARAEEALPQAQSVGPIDEWKTQAQK
jgi:hypothetical protein